MWTGHGRLTLIVFTATSLLLVCCQTRVQTRADGIAVLSATLMPKYRRTQTCVDVGFLLNLASTIELGESETFNVIGHYVMNN